MDYCYQFSERWDLFPSPCSQMPAKAQPCKQALLKIAVSGLLLSVYLSVIEWQSSVPKQKQLQTGYEEATHLGNSSPILDSQY